MIRWGFGVLVVAIAGGFLATAAAAQSSRTSASHSGDYFSLLMFGALPQIDDHKANTGTVLVRNDSDGNGGIGLALGYNWAKKGLPVRSEIEYHFRFRADYDLRIADQAGYENNLETHGLLANFYYDFSVTKRWSAYLGGGIGLAWNNSDVERKALLDFATTTRSDSNVGLAWNLAVGAVWQARENWDLEFRYRYIDLGTIETGPHSDGTTLEADTYYSHDFLMGIVYRF